MQCLVHDFVHVAIPAARALAPYELFLLWGEDYSHTLPRYLGTLLPEKLSRLAISYTVTSCCVTRSPGPTHTHARPGRTPRSPPVPARSRRSCPPAGGAGTGPAA